MNPNSSLAKTPVIPAQAGIQQECLFCKADKTQVLPHLVGIFNRLDSRLRGNDGLLDYLR